MFSCHVTDVVVDVVVVVVVCQTAAAQTLRGGNSTSVLRVSFLSCDSEPERVKVCVLHQNTDHHAEGGGAQAKCLSDKYQ